MPTLLGGGDPEAISQMVDLIRSRPSGSPATPRSGEQGSERQGYLDGNGGG